MKRVRRLAQAGNPVKQDFCLNFGHPYNLYAPAWCWTQLATTRRGAKENPPDKGGEGGWFSPVIMSGARTRQAETDLY